MSSRPLIIATALGVAVGVPYVMSHRPAGAKKDASPYSSFGAPGGGMALPPLTAPGQPNLFVTRPGAATYGPAYGGVAQPSTRNANTQHLQLEQVLRFDITKEWVYSHWARKSTGLADAEFFGVRVPLVTGTDVADLAGSLTYWFDVQDQLQHIAFCGRTGDAARLANFLVRNYKFKPATAPAGEELYQVTVSDGVQSELRARPEPVIWNTSPHGSFEITLELARPGSKRVLPPQGPSLQIPPVAASELRRLR